MKRITLTEKVLMQIAELVEKGNTQKEIKKITGIDHRIFKREYRLWMSEQSEQELQDLRTQAINKTLQEHVDALFELAKFFVLHLEVPQPPDESRKAEVFIQNIWEEDVRKKLGYDNLSNDYGRRESRFLLRQKSLLFQSLKEHTREKVKWGVLENWENSWDVCTQRLFPQMNQAINDVAMGILTNTTVLRSNIKKLGKEARINDWIKKIILQAIWQSISEDKQVQVSREYASGMAPSDPNLDLGTIFEDVVDLCCKAVNTLCNGHNTQLFTDLRREVGLMRQSIDELYDMLNPLVLSPIILRTKCKLCPV